MQDDRPWVGTFVPRLEELAEKEPGLQKHLGMQRQCEHDLVVQVVCDNRAATYVEIGSGNGKLLARVKKALPNARVIGYEITPDKAVVASCEALGIDFRGQDVLADGGISLGEQIKGFIEESDGPVVVYTDNGNKSFELSIVSRDMRPGDICGSHDFSGPDWGSYVRFLKGRNFATMKSYEPYILAHLCLQRFWMKQVEEVTEDPSAPCI